MDHKRFFTFFQVVAATAAITGSTQLAFSQPQPDPGQLDYVAASQPAPDHAGLAPITVGSRDQVGRQRTSERVARSVAGGLLGRGGDRGGAQRAGSRGPSTVRDPTRRLDYVEFEDPATAGKVSARAMWTDDGLLVSTRIDEADDHGTFQAVFLGDCQGRHLYPARLEVYRLWQQHSLTVSWTRTTTVDGQVVSRQHGGWSESWTDPPLTISRSGAEPDEMPGIWQVLGYDRAQAGVRQVGAYFDLDPEAMQDAGDLVLFVHVTRPGDDPVLTRPFLWILSVDEEQPQVEPGQALANGLADDAQTLWGRWTTDCQASDRPQRILTAGPAEPDPGSGLTAAPIALGYPLPPGLEIIEPPVSTGQTTGVIAHVLVHNGSDEPIDFPVHAALVPASGRDQGYVLPAGNATRVPPGATESVPLKGYCAEIRRPPVPEGEPFPGVSDWIVPGPGALPVHRLPETPPADLTTAAGRALIPGTDWPAPTVIDSAHDPETAAAYLIGAAEEIEKATLALQESGELVTPFSAYPEREFETVVQQVLWAYSAELSGRPYRPEEFHDRLVAQYEEQTGVPAADISEEDQQRIEQGSDDFWAGFELVGARAKVLTSVDEKQPDAVPPPEAMAAACRIEEHLDHTEPQSQFVMSEKYKDEARRENLREWFADLPVPADLEEGGTFMGVRHPASAWAVAGRDLVGGYANAVAKHRFRDERGGSDWVWSTELLDVSATSNGTHTLTVVLPDGEECVSVVVGSAGGVVQAWSNVIDPLVGQREILDALRITRDVAIVVASVALAPATGGASVAVGLATLAATEAFDRAFSADADAFTAVEGRMHIKVRRREIGLDAHSRSHLDKDGEVHSDGKRVSTGQVSDQHPTTITATTRGIASLKAQARTNGIAESTVESQIGVAIVALCVCETSAAHRYLTDSGVFLASPGADWAAERAQERLERRIGSIVDNYLEMDDDDRVPSAERDLPHELEESLKNWLLEHGPGSAGYEYFELPRNNGDSGDR